MRKGYQALSILFVGGCLLLEGCAGKVIVTKVPGGERQNLDGVVYALPRTVVKVAIPVTRTTLKKGSHVDYAELFLPNLKDSKDFVSKDVDEKKPKFSVGSPVFSTYGEPDLSKLYFVKVTGKGPVDRTAAIDYTEQGTVSGIQGSEDNYTTDIVLSTVAAVSGIATRVFLAAGEMPEQYLYPDRCPEERTASVRSKDVFKFFQGGSATEVFSNFCKLDDRKKEIVWEDVKAKKGALIEALALYTKIKDYKTARWKLISGSGVAASPSLELMLKEVDALIVEGVAGFVGKKTSETWTPTFELRPRDVTSPPTLLFKLDEVWGICVEHEMSLQDDATHEFISTEACESKSSKEFKVRFSLHGDDQLFKRVQNAFKEDKDEERSFRYLIPAATLVTLEYVDFNRPNNPTSIQKGGKALVMVGQFGYEASLPASSGGRSLNYNLKYFEATGALKSFTLSSKTDMQAANVSSLSSSTNAILDARNKKAKELDEKADELNKLDRQRRILENQVKIQELCQKLDINCAQ